MARRFGASNTDHINAGSLAGLDDLEPFTLLVLTKINTHSNDRIFVRKSSNVGWHFQTSNALGNGNIKFSRLSAGTNQFSVGNHATTSTAEWRWIALQTSFAVSVAHSSDVYGGTGMVTRALWSSDVGAGTPYSDAAIDLQVGGNGGTGSCDADIAVVVVFPTLLTNANLDAAIAAINAGDLPTGAEMYHHYGAPLSSGLVVDQMGNGHSGTITGTSLVDGPVGFPLPGGRRVITTAAAVGRASLW